MAEIKILLEDQIKILWGQGRLDIVDKNYAEKVIDHMPVPEQAIGRTALKDIVTEFRTAIPDLVFHLHGVLVCGDVGVDFWTMTGTHTGSFLGKSPTGKPVSFSGIDMVEVHKGQITDLWHVEEMLQFYGQIGQQAPQFGAPSAATPIQMTADAEYLPGKHAKSPDVATLTTLEKRNLAIAREHIEQIWARGDMSAAYRLYAADVIDHNPAPGQRPGILGIIDVLGWLRESVPDLRMSIQHYVVQGDLAADRWVMRGTHTGTPLMDVPATGRTFEINGMDVIRIRDDGLISDVWHVEELASLRAQIAA